MSDSNDPEAPTQQNENAPSRVQEFQADSFQFYFQFLKPLVLDLPTSEEKAIAAAWVQKIEVDPGTEEGQNIRLDYLKLFLFVLQRGRLSGIFKKQPPSGPLPPFPQGFSMTDMGNLMIDQDDRQTAGAGDARTIPYTIEISNDLREFVAAQEVPNFGVQMYYAWSSDDPIHKWNFFDEEKFPLYVLEKIKQLKESKIDDQGGKTKGYDCQKKPCESPIMEKSSKKKVKSPQEIEKTQRRSYHTYLGLVGRMGGGFKESCEEEFREDVRRERAMMRKRNARCPTVGPIPPPEQGEMYADEYYDSVRIGVSPRTCPCPRPLHQPDCEFYVGGYDEYFPEPSAPARRSPSPAPQTTPVCPPTDMPTSLPPPSTPASGPSPGQPCPPGTSPIQVCSPNKAPTQPCPPGTTEARRSDYMRKSNYSVSRQNEIDRMTLAIPPNTEVGEDDVYNHEYYESIKVGVSPRRECACPTPFHAPGCEQYFTGFEEYFLPEEPSPRRSPQGPAPTMAMSPPKSGDGKRPLSLRPPEISVVAEDPLCLEPPRRSPSPSNRSPNVQGCEIPPPDPSPRSPKCCSCNNTCGCTCPRCQPKTPETGGVRPSYTPRAMNYQPISAQALEQPLSSPSPQQGPPCPPPQQGPPCPPPQQGPPCPPPQQAPPCPPPQQALLCPPSQEQARESPGWLERTAYADLPQRGGPSQQEARPTTASPAPRRRRAHLMEPPRSPYEVMQTPSWHECDSVEPFVPMLTSTQIPWIRKNRYFSPVVINFDDSSSYGDYRNVEEAQKCVPERTGGPSSRLQIPGQQYAMRTPPPRRRGLPEKYFEPDPEFFEMQEFEDVLSGESADECPREQEDSSCEWEILRGPCVSKEQRETPYQRRLNRTYRVDSRAPRGTRPSRVPVARPRQTLGQDPVTVRRTPSGLRTQAPAKPPRRTPQAPVRPEPLRRTESTIKPVAPPKPPRRHPPRPESMRPEPPPKPECVRPEPPPETECVRPEPAPRTLVRAGPSTECPQTPKTVRRRPRILTSTPIKSNFAYPGFDMTCEPSAIYGEEQSMFQNMSSIMEPPSWVPPPPPLSPIRAEPEQMPFQPMSPIQMCPQQMPLHQMSPPQMSPRPMSPQQAQHLMAQQAASHHASSQQASTQQNINSDTFTTAYEECVPSGNETYRI